MAIHSRLASKQFRIRQLESIFKLIHTHGVGRVALEEFEEGMQNERLRALLASNDVIVGEVVPLFELLDRESNHMLTAVNLVTCCPKLRGRARTIDVDGMMYEDPREIRVDEGSKLRPLVLCSTT